MRMPRSTLQCQVDPGSIVSAHQHEYMCNTGAILYTYVQHDFSHVQKGHSFSGFFNLDDQLNQLIRFDQCQKVDDHAGVARQMLVSHDGLRPVNQRLLCTRRGLGCRWHSVRYVTGDALVRHTLGLLAWHSGKSQTSKHVESAQSTMLAAQGCNLTRLEAHFQ